MSARSPRLWTKRIRTAGAAILAGLAMMVVTSTRSEADTAPTQFVSLEGTGSWSIWQNVVPWQNDLVSTSKYVNFNYTRHGSYLGRESIINGTADFTVSGVGFDPDQLRRVKAKAGGVISAPVQVAALGTFVEPLYFQEGASYKYTHQICNPDADPSEWPPGVTDFGQCIPKATYTGPVRIPNENLAAIYANYKVGNPSPSSWNAPGILRAFGLDPQNGADDAAYDSFEPPSAFPAVAGRSDPDETNFYLSMFMKFANPPAAAQMKITDPSERLTEFVGATSDGAEQQLAQLAHDGCGVTGANCGASFAASGAVAAAPPSGMISFKSAFPSQRLDLAQMQNANGDWVGPTSDSINKAVDAGGDTPLYALDHKVEGAYPLVWVDRLYAPAHGLSPEKTEGLAMLIRYLATTGQENEAKVGEGRLTPAMISEALSSANALVESNCVGGDRKLVVDNELGPLAPPDATAMQSITGEIKHCVAVPKPATTTTTTTPGVSSNGGGDGGSNLAGGDTGTGTVDNSGSSNNGSGSSNNATDTPNNPADIVGGTTIDPITGKVRVKNTSVLLTATNLPMPAPTGRSGADRLGAFLLGVFLFLLLRKPVQRLFTKSVA